MCSAMEQEVATAESCAGDSFRFIDDYDALN
jgi:hypothetical protein